MPKRGPDPKVGKDELHELLLSGSRPVWSTSAIAEEFDVARQTVHKHLTQLVEEKDDVETIRVGQTAAYYVPGVAAEPPETTISLEELHRQSLKREFTDKFVGLQTDPSTAVHPRDGPAEAGDKIQIEVEGLPGDWHELMRHTWDSRRYEYLHDRISSETQAQISGELVAKPTTPIEHTDYPDDYDLESETGAEVVEKDGRNFIVAGGFKAYLLRPCNDAVFLTDVSVDWMSPKGEGREAVEYSVDDLIEDLDNSDTGF